LIFREKSSINNGTDGPQATRFRWGGYRSLSSGENSIVEQNQGEIGQLNPQDYAHKLGIEFADPLLLTRALTHRSYLNEHP
jgi:hypothetical protein